MENYKRLLDVYYEKFLKEAERIIKNKLDYKHDCGGEKECASCLAAFVRSKYDNWPTDDLSLAEGDVLMINLRNEIAKKYKGWRIN